MKFFQFGCWNQLKEKKSICDNRNPTNPLSRVMKTLAEKTIETAPDFIIISGDNYYSEKPEVVVKKKNNPSRPTHFRLAMFTKRY